MTEKIHMEFKKKKENLLQTTVNHTGTLFLNSHNDHVPAFRTDVFPFQEIRKRQKDSFSIERVPSPGCPFQIGCRCQLNQEIINLHLVT